MKTFEVTETPTIENFDNSRPWYDAKYGVNGWHDADECGYDDCRLAYSNDPNCRCADCCSEFD